jgi:uncharacterized protein YfaS (alpha-2-macroglobulin family)
VNRLDFTTGAPGMLYRATFRFRPPGREVNPQADGLRVAREFWLLNEQGKPLRQLESGEKVSRGAYLECRVAANRAFVNTAMRHVLVESPKPSCCEVIPDEDKRFEQDGTHREAREDRDTLVAFIHERMRDTILDRCVLHVERTGTFLVPPAQVELMYEPEVRGHSGTFRLQVVD